MTERYEEVRRKLVERGYLHGPIQRFLLRDALAAQAPRAFIVTSAKAAVLGAPILGGLLAAATVAANRPMLTARDAMVLWLYFAVLAGVGLFALDVMAAWVAGLGTRRRGARSSDTMRAGLIVAVPVLAYLVILWSRGRPEGSVASDALFLAGAVTTASLVAWLAGLVSLARIVGRTGEVPDRNRRGALLMIGVLLPVAALFFVLPAAAPLSGSHAAAPSVFPRDPKAPRLIVVGIDGLDGALVAGTSAEGGSERLLAFFARGALYPKHRGIVEPAEAWTTIATGMTADAHGMRHAGAARLPGIAVPIAPRSSPAAIDAALRYLFAARTVPATGAGRRVRTLWEITGLSRPSAVVGWWSSWPARGTEGDPETGYVVSDRVLAKLLSGGAEDRDAQPSALYARLAHDFSADRSAWRASFDLRFSEFPTDVRSIAWESFLIDAFAWKTSLRLLEDPDVATSFTYLPGLDILRTRLGGPRDAAAAVRAYLRWIDDSVFSDLAERQEEQVLVVADPGRSAGEDAEGFVAAVGSGATPSCVGPPVGDLDVAPIALRLARLPASREMAGRAPASCFEGALPALTPIETWGRRGSSAASAGSDYDPEMVERLKSLGYLR